ncbi:MAG: hypothetical protein KKD76_01330 [Verrucomicrobia bacterium]|nr:hypothetical protein [Verrucomicrobiota bacterium]
MNKPKYHASFLDAQYLERLTRNNLVYPDAPRFWQDGFIIGNGDVGAIAYAPYHVEWTVNKTDVFDGRTGNGKFLKDCEVREHLCRTGARNLRFLNECEPSDGPSPVSKSCGLIKIRFGDEYSWGAVRPHQIEQRLNLAEATCQMKLDMHLSHPRIRSFVAADRNALAIRIDRVSSCAWGYRVELVQPFDVDWASPAAWGQDDGMVWFTQEMPHGGACYAMVAPRYRVKHSQLGKAHQLGDRAWLDIQGHADLFVTLVTSYESKDPLAEARRLARETRAEGFERLAERHRQWWGAFWSKSWMELPDDPEVERSWYFSLYETGSLLRKAPVPGLYGLWYGHTDSARVGLPAAWYTHDQNVQIPIMPVFVTNHPELVEPFMDTYLNVLPELQRHTREVYERPGVCVPLVSNQLGQALPARSYRYSLIGGAYNGLLFVWAYRFTRDEELLKKRIYPFLREITRFYVAWMDKMPDGRYRLDILIPPEIGTLSHNDISTLALFKPCLELAIEASRKLRQDEAECRQWEDVLAHYPELPTRDGLWVSGSDIELSHYIQAAYLLYPLFPAGDSSSKTTEITARTFDRITERDIEISYADEAGRWHFRRAWAHFFPTMALLRLGRTDAAWSLMLDALRIYQKPNGLFSHNPVIQVPPEITERNVRTIPKGKLGAPGDEPSPLSEFQSWDAPNAATMNTLAGRLVGPVSEGSGAWLMMATETLLQSHGGCIRLFPGLPGGKRAKFGNLRAEGGVLVSAERGRENVQSIRLVAIMPVAVRLMNPWSGTQQKIAAKRNGKKHPLASDSSWEFTFDRAGDTVEIEC